MTKQRQKKKMKGGKLQVYQSLSKGCLNLGNLRDDSQERGRQIFNEWTLLPSKIGEEHQCHETFKSVGFWKKKKKLKDWNPSFPRSHLPQAKDPLFLTWTTNLKKESYRGYE